MAGKMIIIWKNNQIFLFTYPSSTFQHTFQFHTVARKVLLRIGLSWLESLMTLRGMLFKSPGIPGTQDTGHGSVKALWITGLLKERRGRELAGVDYVKIKKVVMGFTLNVLLE